MAVVRCVQVDSTSREQNTGDNNNNNYLFLVYIIVTLPVNRVEDVC